MRKICFVLVDRANYGRLKPLMEASWQYPGLDCFAVVAGSMVLNRFKCPADLLIKDGFGIRERLYISLEGNTPSTMTRGIGIAINEFTGAFDRINPDVVVLIGDRFEALGAAIAATYTRRCILHLQGGEVSGSLDEITRHAITKMAHYHAPATEQAKRNILQLGERPDSIISVGCPVSDVALRMNVERGESILCVYHPDTNCPDLAAGEMRAVLEILEETGRNVILLWPNIDAGSDAVSKVIRVFRDERGHPDWLNVATNFEPEEYLTLLASASLCVGNSSSFVRDAGYFGTPVKLIGDRQAGRERSPNNRTLYGDGRVCSRIVPQLCKLTWYEKKFHALHRHHPGPGRLEGNPAEEHGHGVWPAASVVDY